LAWFAIAANPVAAEPARSAQSARVLPAYEILTIVRSTGLDPLGAPIRHGTSYVLRAIDVGGEEVRVVVDARTGRIQSIDLADAGPRGAPPRIAHAPYPFYEAPPYFGRPRFRVLPPDFDDEEFMPMPPGIETDEWRPRPRAAPPAAARPPAARSAAVTPVRPPLPRPRPATAAAVRSTPVVAPQVPAAAPKAAPAEVQAAPKPSRPAPEPLSKPSTPPVLGFE
jgi:hypothetical protein